MEICGFERDERFQKLILDAECAAAVEIPTETDDMFDSESGRACAELALMFETRFQLLNGHSTHTKFEVASLPVRPANALRLSKPLFYSDDGPITDDEDGDEIERFSAISCTSDVTVEYINVAAGGLYLLSYPGSRRHPGLYEYKLLSPDSDLERIALPDEQEPQYYCGPFLYCLVDMPATESAAAGPRYVTSPLRDVVISPRHIAYQLQ